MTSAIIFYSLRNFLYKPSLPTRVLRPSGPKLKGFEYVGICSLRVQPFVHSSAVAKRVMVNLV